MKVQNMISKKSGKKVANQFMITERNYIAFQSYDTLICEFINKLALGYDAVLRVNKMYNV